MSPRWQYVADLAERAGWTFLQAAGAEWLVTSSFDWQSLQLAAAAGVISVVKSLVATQIGAPNTAATLPVTTDTERG